jgi:hypothetical protein
VLVVAAPPGLKWQDQAAFFIDRLVDRDILYLDAQIAIEELIHAGLHDRITASFDLNGITIHWHPMPPIFMGARPLDVFTTIEQDGTVHVLYIRFADGA